MINSDELSKGENFDLDQSFHSEIDESENKEVDKDDNILKLIEFIKAVNIPEVKNWVTKCVDLNHYLKKNKKNQYYYKGENPETVVPLSAALESFPVFNMEIIETLLNAGASPEVKFIFNREYSGDKSNFDYTLLSRAIDFIIFDRRNPIELVDLLIKHGADPNRYCNSFHENRGGTGRKQFTVLHKVIESQEVQLVECLLRNGADPNQQFIEDLSSSQSNYLLTKRCQPIHLATRIHNREKGIKVVRALHKAGANIHKGIKYVDSVKDEKVEFRKATVIEYPIHVAVMARNEYVIWYLLNNGVQDKGRVLEEKKFTISDLVDQPALRNGLFILDDEEVQERNIIVKELLRRNGKMYPVSKESRDRMAASFYCLKRIRNSLKSTLIHSVFEFMDLGSFAL